MGESNGDMQTRALMWPHRKKSIGVRSRDLGNWPAPSNLAIVVSDGEMLILKRMSLTISLKQQQPSGSNLAFLRGHVSLCCVLVSCVSTSVAVRLNIYSKLVGGIIFSLYFSGFA